MIRDPGDIIIGPSVSTADQNHAAALDALRVNGENYVLIVPEEVLDEGVFSRIFAHGDALMLYALADALNNALEAMTMKMLKEPEEAA